MEAPDTSWDDIGGLEDASLPAAPAALAPRAPRPASHQPERGACAVRAALRCSPNAEPSHLLQVKLQLREAVDESPQRASAMARLGAAPHRGVLLYGPPGCRQAARRPPCGRGRLSLPPRVCPTRRPRGAAKPRWRAPRPPPLAATSCR